MWMDGTGEQASHGMILVTRLVKSFTLPRSESVTVFGNDGKGIVRKHLTDIDYAE